MQGGFVVPRINLRPQETAQELLAALESGGELPLPPLVPDIAAGQGSLGGQLAQRDGPPASPCLPLRERQRLLALRGQLQAEEAWRAADAAAAAAAAPESAAPPRLARGAYSAASQRLAAWLAEYLAVQQRNKRVLMKWWWCCHPMGGTTPAHAESSVAICERDTLLARLDGLWADFLAVSSGGGAGWLGLPGTGVWLATCLAYTWLPCLRGCRGAARAARPGVPAPLAPPPRLPLPCSLAGSLAFSPGPASLSSHAYPPPPPPSV